MRKTAALAQAQTPASQDRYGAAVVAGHVALFNCSARFNGGQSDARIERDIFTPVRLRQGTGWLGFV